MQVDIEVVVRFSVEVEDQEEADQLAQQYESLAAEAIVAEALTACVSGAEVEHEIGEAY